MPINEEAHSRRNKTDYAPNNYILYVVSLEIVRNPLEEKHRIG